MKIGYARVSTREQAASLEAQREALQAAGCARVYSDTISGAKSARPGLSEALDYLRTGDVLMVTRLDRLGRSTLDTVRTVDQLTAAEVRLEILDLGIDSGTSEGRLMIRIMSALAEQELETIRARTKVGLEHARKNGRHGGRRPALDPDAREAALAALAGGMSEKAVAAFHGVSRSTITRLKKNHDTPRHGAV